MVSVSDFLFPDLDFPLQFAVSEVLQMCSGWNDFMRLLLINILLQSLVIMCGQIPECNACSGHYQTVVGKFSQILMVTATMQPVDFMGI